MARAEYKFKPYKPTKFKLKKPGEDDKLDKQIASLEKQRENLNKRLLAEGVDPETLGGEFDNRNILEKALNLDPDQGLLMDFFEVIDRPVQAVKNALIAGQKGDNMLKAFGAGLSGTEEVTGAEFLKEIANIDPKSGIGQFAANIATDIVFDPLTYLPPGILMKGLSKLGKIGSKTITRQGKEIAEQLAKNVDELVKLAKAGDADTLKKVFTQEQIDIMVNAVEVKGKGSAAEILANTEIKKILENNGLGELSKKFQVVNKGTIRGTAEQGLRNSKDLAVVFEYEPGKFIQTSTIEVKDLISATGKRQGAFGLSTAISVEDLTSTGTQGMKAKFLEKTKDVTFEVGKKKYKMKDYIDDLIRTKTSGQKSILSTKGKIKVSDADKAVIEDALKEVFLDDLADAGVDFVTFRYGQGKVATLSRANVAKYIGIKNASIGVKASGAFVGSKGLAGIADFLSQKFKSQKNLITEAFANATSVKKAAGVNANQTLKGGFVTANSNIVVGGLNDEIAQSLVGSTVNFGTTQINISSVGKLDDGRYVIKTSKSEAGKASRDLLAGIDLVDEAGNPLTNGAIEALDEGEAFGKSLIESRETTKTITETITLAGRARRGEFGETVQTVAKALKKFEIDFKLTFNLTAGFDEQTKALIRKAYGEDMFQLEKRSGALAEIKRKLIAIDPDAGTLLGEIIEADAKLGPNGTIVKLKRRMGTSDFLDYAYKSITDGNGDKIIIPSFADEATQRSFIQRLQKLYKDATGSTDIMFTIKKGPKGGTVVAFAGDASEMKDLIKYVQAAPMMNRQIPNYLEFGEKALSAKAKRFLRNNVDQIEKYRGLSNELLDDLVNKAGFKNLPADLQKQIGYMRHTMSKEAMEGLRRQMPGVLSIYTTPGKNTLGVRKVPGSVLEINAAMSDFFGMSEDFFDPNAFNAMEDLIKQTSRKLDQKQVLDIILENKGVDGSSLFKVVDNTQEAKALMSPYDTMIKDFKEDFSSLYNNLSDDARKVFDDFLKKNGYGAGKAIQMNKSAFNVLKGVEKAYFDVPKLAKIYDKFLNTWKGLTLITPGFHMRNLFGNMFNSYAVGMDVASQSRYLGLAMQEMDQFQKIGKKLAQGASLSNSERKIFETVRGYFEQGVSQTHRGIRDLEGVMEASAKGAQKGGLKGTFNNVIRINFNFAEKMDDVQRYALYRWSLDKTGDGVKAANTVAEALFDYSHLTPFEKSYMKRLFPFYTFMKNNFVFQMKNIFRNPAQYAKLGRAYKYASEDLAGYSLDDLPDYATENMWLPLPWTVDKNDEDAVAFLKATLPASDFTELVENPFKKGVTSITAPIKLLIEFGAGKDLFTGQPLEAFPGQTSAMPEGTGVLSSIRDRRGNLTITQSPLFIKIMNDLGLRAPINIASAGLDVVDTLAGYQGTPENLGDFLQRAGIAGVSEMDRLKLSRLYQDLEKLRELKKFYEQETGNQLPVLPRG